MLNLTGPWYISGSCLRTFFRKTVPALPNLCRHLVSFPWSGARRADAVLVAPDTAAAGELRGKVAVIGSNFRRSQPDRRTRPRMESSPLEVWASDPPSH